MAKSGTHSIAGLFAKNYRTAHEPEDGLLVDALTGHVVLDKIGR